VLTMGYRAIGMIIVTTVLNIVFNLINLVYSRKLIKFKVRLSGLDLKLIKEISGYSFFVFIGIMVDRIYWGTGQLLLGMMVNTVAVSVFAIGIQFVNIFYIPMSVAVSGLFLPKLTAISLEKEHGKRLSDIFVRVGRIQFVILGIVLSGFVIYGQSFIKLWVGDSYADSYYVALILMVPLTIPLTQNIGISILQAKNMHAFRSISYLIVAVANIIISIIFIKMFGTIGGATGTAFSLIVGQIIIMNIYYKKKMELDIKKFWIEITKLLPAILVTCVFGLVFKNFVPSTTFLKLIINVIVFSIIYTASMYLIGINKYEKDLFVTPLVRLWRKIFRRGKVE